MLHTTVPELYFIGLVQPLSVILRVSEWQSEFAADHVQGRYALPEPPEVDCKIDRRRKAVAKSYIASKQPTIQVEFDDYRRPAQRARRRARRRTTAKTASHAHGITAVSGPIVQNAQQWCEALTSVCEDHLDLLVNAGLLTAGPFFDTDLERHRRSWTSTFSKPSTAPILRSRT